MFPGNPLTLPPCTAKLMCNHNEAGESLVGNTDMRLQRSKCIRACDLLLPLLLVV